VGNSPGAAAPQPPERATPGATPPGPGAPAGAGRRGPSSAKRALGRAGEDLAARWYWSRGYQVVARNWSSRSGELDIVARRGALTVFCEVKARSSGAFGSPAEAVGHSKQVRLRRLAAMWFAEQARAGKEVLGNATSPPPQQAGGRSLGLRLERRGGPVRFDVACVLAGSVEVVEGAF
jgi:putative endonuclease